MGMQDMSTSPARNQSKAAVIPGEIKVGAGHPSTVVGKQFNKNAPVTGPGVKGFSGNGLLNGFLKS